MLVYDTWHWQLFNVHLIPGELIVFTEECEM